MAVSTLSSGTREVPYMPMTTHAILCPAPILIDDFKACQIPGGVDLWSRGGFYSPGECFTGYQAECTQNTPLSNGWPLRKDETAVRCIPFGYDCNDPKNDQRFATSDFDGTVLSAPAFEIRWRSEDLKHGSGSLPSSDTLTFPPTTTEPFSASTVTLPTTPTTYSSFEGSGTTSTVTSTAISSSSPRISTHQLPPPPEPTRSDAGSTPASEDPEAAPLSTGSIAGIAVGSSVALIGLVMAIICLLLRHQRRKTYAGAARLPEDYWGQGAYADSTSPPQQPVELEHKPLGPRELSADCAARPKTKMSGNGEEMEQGVHPHDPRARHISLNDIPIEMAAEAVSRPLKSPSASQIEQ